MRALWMVALLVAGCGHFHSSDGVSEVNGVLYKQGVALPYHRWVPLAVPEGTVAIRLESPTQQIAVSAGDPALEVQVYSEIDGDGTVALANGEPQVSSTSGRAVLINGVRGTLMPGIRLNVSAGTGDIRLQAFDGAGIELNTGTGDALLQDCKLPELELKSGTGEVRLEGSDIQKLQARLGTGDLRLRASQLHGGEITSGTGDVVLSGGSSLGTIRPETGTGEVRHDD